MESKKGELAVLECYACSLPATSKEHVPAKCFFPADPRYRKNLIKVPSCDMHNSAKSGDDFYALLHVAPLLGLGKEVMHQDTMISQIRRSMERDSKLRGGAFCKRILSEITEKNDVLIAGKSDGDRMKKVMRLCARGVYYHTRGKRWEAPLRVAFHGNDPRDPKKLAENAKMEESLEAPFAGISDLGDNPTVFRFAIVDVDAHKSTLVRLTFYDAFRWWVFYHPEAENMELD